ncbi:hypothetical protein M5M_01375 [Simiduia agarivorans SA1 = DSM 21679]|uniref:DUF547 domain-containing protein n=1 Tax=Simiduia agarivorans (strain DSM 21679 / JCM 13881 / BCRC 17597 / SA1) TaxID=1117647 RepID=K4KU49_SIMAS|nr:hypothetical protein M5M_01375 [Simiduia agarivorans SA1 = DSM 21679]
MRKRVFYGAGALLARLVVLLCLLGYATLSCANEHMAELNAGFDRWLAEYLVQNDDGINRLPYGRIPKDSLDAYVNAMAALEPSAMSQDEAFSYWVNLYNSLIIRLVLREQPASSIRQIKPGLTGLLAGGPWKQDQVVVEGKSLSFDDIEHGILRVQWREPRVHFVLNCASLGCPNLPAVSIKPAQLEQQLTEAAAAFLQHPRAIRLEQKTLVVNQIFNWFAEDFGRNETEVLDWIAQFKGQPLPAHASVRYEYDWALNRAP